nr:hypothetical protein [Tanacetum cinerariifolium]
MHRAYTHESTIEDENPIRPLGDYSKHSHEGYMNTIELSSGNNMVSSSIREHPWSLRHSVLHGNPEQAFVEYTSSRTDEAGEPKTRDSSSFICWLLPNNRSQCSSHPSNSINAIKAHFKEATISQPSPQQPKIKTKPLQPEKPKPTFEDELQDLHLNLPVLEVLAHAPIYNSILDKYVESLEIGRNKTTFVQGEMAVKKEDLGLFTLSCRLGDSKPFDNLADLGSCVNIVPLYLFKKLNIKLLEEFDHVFGLADNSETPLLVGRGFLATANAVIDCRMAKIAVGEGLTRKDFLDCHLPGEQEIAKDAELNRFKDTLVFRMMVEFLGAIPINLNCNMWESENLIENPINWDKPPKTKIELGMPRLE